MESKKKNSVAQCFFFDYSILSYYFVKLESFRAHFGEYKMAFGLNVSVPFFHVKAQY